MLKTNKHLFHIALRALPFAAASVLFAACNGGGTSGATPILPETAPQSTAAPADVSAPGVPAAPSVTPAPSVTVAPQSTATPAGTVAGMSIVARSGNTYTITGSVAAFIRGGFQIQGGAGVGYEHILTNSNTVYSGAKPYIGEKVEVVASGTLSSGSLTASKVMQRSSGASTATPKPATASTSGTMWHIGQSYALPSTSDGDYQHPSLSGSAANFSMTRNWSGTNNYRNQMNPTIGGSVIRLTPGVTYDWKFQTVSLMQSDANYSQNLIFQIHDYNAGTSPITVLGTQNINNGRTVWYFHSGSGTWTGAYTYGATDTWEIQVKISDSGTGVERLYRNGALVSSQTGSNYSASSQGYPWWNFGPYEWDWKASHSSGQISRLTSLDFKFNYMNFGKI